MPFSEQMCDGVDLIPQVSRCDGEVRVLMGLTLEMCSAISPLRGDESEEALDLAWSHRPGLAGVLPPLGRRVEHSNS